MKHEYGTVTTAIVKQLRKIAGEPNVLVDRERMEGYSHDETSVEQYAAMPEVVVTPVTTSQVAQIMKLADTHRIPVTPRGAGSGSPAGDPIYGGIVLSVEKMNSIVEIDEANLTVTAQAGIVRTSSTTASKSWDCSSPAIR